MNKIWLIFFSVIFITSCGGGGGGGSYNNSGENVSATPTNLNPNNACKTAWYTSMPSPSSSNSVFNNYSFFWQSTSFENMLACPIYYKNTTNIIETGGVSWETYIGELVDYSKNTLGQIVPLNIFVLGADAGTSPYDKIVSSDVNSSERASYNTDFATVQAPLSDYTNALANYDAFPLESAGGGYSHEAAPNGADMQLPQGLIWNRKNSAGNPGFASDAERIQESLKVIAHEYFHVYQNSIKFYNEAAKTISLPKAWFLNPSLLDPSSASSPAYFPWYIEEGGAEFGGIVLSAKYANTKSGITTNPAQQFEDHFSAAFDYFAGNAGRSLADFNLTGNTGYSAGASALLYLWYKDERNFNAAMTRYYTTWQEAELGRSGNGWQDAFEDVFWKNSTQYYNLDEFVNEFNNWIRSDTKANLWNVIAKTSNEIIHADVIPTTVNTLNSDKKTIQVEAAAKIVGAGTGNRYFIDGVQQKTLVVQAGQEYKFSYPAGHPFRFSTTANGTHGGGSIFTNGVSVNEASNEITITIPSSGTSILYYFCTIHGGMGGQIIVSDQVISYSGGNSGGGGSGY